MVLSFFSILAPHRTELSKVFQAGCFDFARVKESVELCINISSLIPLLNPSFNANCEQFDSE